MTTLSIVVPTSGRLDSLRQSLAALARQVEDAAAEILCVFDGPAIDAALSREFGKVAFLRTGAVAGPSVARNLGAAQARGSTLLFVDDDVVVAHDALRRLRSHLERTADAAWVGHVRPHPQVAASCYVDLAYRDLAHSRPRASGSEVTSWRFCTSLAAVPADVFRRVRGFDERFQRPGYEDVELAFRLRQAGCRLLACDDVSGQHLKVMDRAWFVARCDRLAATLRLLHTLQPASRTWPYRWAERLRLSPAPFRLGWRMARRALPRLEALPCPLALPALRLAHACALAAGYLGGRRAPPAAV